MNSSHVKYLRPVNEGDSFDSQPVANGNQATHDTSMTDMNREEVKARLEAAEARMHALADSMRLDSDRVRASVDLAVSKIDSASSVAQADMRAFRSDALHIASETKSQVLEEVHKLRAWVLTGALTGVLGLLGAVIGYFVPAHNHPTPTQVTPLAQPIVIQVPAQSAQSQPPQAAKHN